MLTPNATMPDIGPPQRNKHIYENIIISVIQELYIQDIIHENTIFISHLKVVTK